MTEHNSNQEADRFNSMANNFFDATRESRALKAAILATISPQARRSMGSDVFAVAELAIEVIGKGDASSVLGVYGAGGKIEESVILALDTAVEFSRRKGSNANDEFQRLADMHGWSF